MSTSLQESTKKVSAMEVFIYFFIYHFEKFQTLYVLMSLKFDFIFSIISEVVSYCVQEEAKIISIKVSKLKQLMHWDDEELRAWEDLHNRKGEDVCLLQQFINEDAAQFKVN